VRRHSSSRCDRPTSSTTRFCRLLLGVQLQCAQCHDHPFTSWKRSDYWSMAAFFTKVRAGGKKVAVAKKDRWKT